MNIKLFRRINKLVITIFILLLFIFPPKVYAGESLFISWLAFDEKGDNYWIAEEVIVFTKDKSQALKLVFDMLFSGGTENTYPFPDGTKTKGANIVEGALTINATKEILDYGGGKYFENMLIWQIMKTSLDIDGVEKVTLLIEDMPLPLTEGGVIKESSEYPILEERQ